MSTYSVQQHPINTLLEWVKSHDIAIPEIQRPFVWDSTKVRDLIDSLFKGYPVGYIITWKNPNVKLKDGSFSEGKKVLIDGQQRITALTTAVLGHQVLDKKYRKKRIKIAFHPFENKFEVFNTAINNNKAWLPDISPIISGSEKMRVIRKEYLKYNPDADEDKLEESIENLRAILNRLIGVIELHDTLDINTVTNIFIRINSQGVVLSQADFVMSKIAADEKYGGNLLRKTIDYFCHIYNESNFVQLIQKNDPVYAASGDFQRIKWIADSNDNIYWPEYHDLLRVAFTYKFNRGMFADLVSLLSGRNFETRSFEASIAEDSFNKLKEGIFGFVNQTNYERFIMCIHSAGFIDYWMIRSKNALDFSYVIYLKLKDLKRPQNEIERLVKRWFVMAMLTGRYSGSAESSIDYDIKQIGEKGVDEFLTLIEAAEMGEGFWTMGLVDNLNSSSSNNTAFIVYLASQIKSNKKGFLSKDITVRDMVQYKGDIHHLFPRDLLKKAGFTRGQYNQVANYVYTQQEINIQLRNHAPETYTQKIREQCDNGSLKIGNIADWNELEQNLSSHDIPKELFLNAQVEHYQDFLTQRQKLMAKTIENYYKSL